MSEHIRFTATDADADLAKRLAQRLPLGSTAVSRVAWAAGLRVLARDVAEALELAAQDADGGADTPAPDATKRAAL